MGKNCTNSEVIAWDFNEAYTEGYNALGAFECALVNLGIIADDDISNIEDTESFDEKYSKERTESPNNRRSSYNA